MSSVVLLSGGMDSATALAWATQRGPVVSVVSVDYGQRHRRELDAAAALAAHYGVRQVVLDLSSFAAALTGNALTDPTVPVPEGHYSAPSIAATVVPNRNATFLMAAAGVAAAAGADTVVTAVHAGDHPIYPDCRPEFIAAADHAVPYHLTWSCYQGGDIHCGRCGTCVERIEAFTDAGITDPTRYEGNAS